MRKKPVVFLPATTSSPPKTQDAPQSDAQSPLPQNPQAEILPADPNELPDSAFNRRARETYVRVLARTGDEIRAMAEALGVPEETAREHLVEWTERLVTAGASQDSVETLLARYAATSEIRIAKLAWGLHSDHPGVWMRAEERLAAIESAAGSQRKGVNAESLIRLALQRIAQRRQASEQTDGK